MLDLYGLAVLPDGVSEVGRADSLVDVVRD
jgi:hypothetical protein